MLGGGGVLSQLRTVWAGAGTVCYIRMAPSNTLQYSKMEDEPGATPIRGCFHTREHNICLALLCFALFCSALLCFALLRFASLCFALLRFAFEEKLSHVMASWVWCGAKESCHMLLCFGFEGRRKAVTCYVLNLGL